MRTRSRFLPIIEAEAGMVLGMPVRVASHGQLRFSLPAGHTLTGDNLHQLSAHRAEFIFIAEPDKRTDEEVAVDAARAAHRVMDIFAPPTCPTPSFAPLKVIQTK